MDYRDRLISLEMLPLMMEYEIADIMFLIKSLKNPSTYFNILDFVTFNNIISNTRSSSNLKLRHSVFKSNIQGHFYFHRLPRLWNSLPLIDTSLSIRSIRAQLRITLLQTLIPTICAHIITFVHALTVLSKMQFNYFM